MHNNHTDQQKSHQPTEIITQLTMEYRPLEIKVMSADDLKNVNLVTKMNVYVAISVPTAERQRTRVDRHGGRSPCWNQRLSFSVAESVLSPDRDHGDHYPSNLTFKIKSQRLLGDREIGEVVVPLEHLLRDYTMSSSAASVGGGDCPADLVVEYQVRSTSGRPKGTFNFSYKFGEKITAQTVTKNPNKVDSPFASYPVPPGIGYATAPPPYGNPAASYPPQQPGYGYPQPLQGYGSGYPVGPAYGYAPQPQVAYGSYGTQYGAPLVGQQHRKKKMGGGKMGMGMGLGAGLLGGMLLGDMVSDVGEMGEF